MEVLRLDNVSKFYTSRTSVVLGLSSINLSFSVGEFVAITGESGSGKSTLAHILGGIIPYESGEMHIYGEPTSHYSSSDWENYRRDLISFISQSYGILVGNTVLENVEAALRFSGTEKKDARKKALEILKEVDLYQFRHRNAGKLSSGQKQRLSIARALAKPSKILIADEPTGNLDSENSDKIIKLLHKASKDHLVILITHEFSEVADYATRRIILADAAVITDAPLREPYCQDKAEEEACVSVTAEKAEPVNEKDRTENNEKASSKKKRKFLSPYVTFLTIKSRPVFSSIITILLTFTLVITFVFLGTFTIALDDSSTRIYDDKAFANGDKTRLLVLKANNKPFTDDELNKILEISHVKSVDRWGSVTDTNYYYRNGVDYSIYQEVKEKENYYGYGGNEVYMIDKVRFHSNDLYMSTTPITQDNVITDGKAPEGMYEVLSADPNHKVGDMVTVHIRNRKWPERRYMSIKFKVVGKTDFGSGLYFSDAMANFIDHSTFAATNDTLFLPYDKDSFTVVIPSVQFDSLSEEEVLYPGSIATYSKDIGNTKYFSSFKTEEDKSLGLGQVGIYRSEHPNLYLVHQSVYEKYMPQNESNQTVVNTMDYSYTDRVISDLKELGYLVVCPYRIGAVEVDEELSSQRLVTLGVCLAAFALTVVLQFILMKAMFNSINNRYKLMSNIGLTARVAYGSVSLMMLFYTLIGEALGLGVILVLNGTGFSYVVDIFKYVSFGIMIVFILSHMLLCAFSLLSVCKSIKKQVFETEKAEEDVNFRLMEEVEIND